MEWNDQYYIIYGNETERFNELEQAKQYAKEQSKSEGAPKFIMVVHVRETAVAVYRNGIGEE